MITDKQLSELLQRSKDGEGVMRILEDMGINPCDGTDWLQKHHRQEVEEAKAVQKARNGRS